MKIDISRLEEKIEGISLVRSIVHNAVSLFAYYLLDGKGVSDFAGEGTIHKDLHPRIMFDVPKLAYESIPTERLITLTALLDKKMPFPEGIVIDTLDEKLSRFRNETERFGSAVASFLKAEILSFTVSSYEKRPEEAIELYIKTYESNPVFALNQGIPFMLSPNFEKYHRKIFPRLIAATPHFKWLYIDYLNYLKNKAKDMEEFTNVFNQAAPVFGGEDSLKMVLKSSEMFKEGL